MLPLKVCSAELSLLDRPGKRWQDFPPAPGVLQNQKRKFDGLHLKEATTSNKRQATAKAAEVPVVTAAAIQLPPPWPTSSIARISPSSSLKNPLSHYSNSLDSAPAEHCKESLALPLFVQGRISESDLQDLLEQIHGSNIVLPLVMEYRLRLSSA
jgi:hypothetical protein